MCSSGWAIRTITAASFRLRCCAQPYKCQLHCVSKEASSAHSGGGCFSHCSRLAVHVGELVTNAGCRCDCTDARCMTCMPCAVYLPVSLPSNHFCLLDSAPFARVRGYLVLTLYGAIFSGMLNCRPQGGSKHVSRIASHLKLKASRPAKVARMRSPMATLSTRQWKAWPRARAPSSHRLLPRAAGPVFRQWPVSTTDARQYLKSPAEPLLQPAQGNIPRMWPAQGVIAVDRQTQRPLRIGALSALVRC